MRPYLSAAGLFAGGSVLLGCGLISGLDSLEVDGGTDSGDAGGDGGGDGQSGVVCGRNTSNPKCFGTTCTATQTCCVTAQSKTCEPMGLCLSGAPLMCTDPVGCDAGVCCLEGFTLNTMACPWVVGAGATTKGIATLCGSCGADAPDSSVLRVCNSDEDCDSMTHCHAVQLAINSDAKFGVCM